MALGFILSITNAAYIFGIVLMVLAGMAMVLSELGIDLDYE